MEDETELINYMICALIEDLRENNEDIEIEMKKVGHILGRSLLEYLEFHREIDLQSLLYKITYTLLDKLHPSSRKLEASTESKNEFFIYEYEPMYSKHVSLPDDWKDFCPESIVCGVIEYSLLASGFDCVVDGYVRPTEKYPDTVVYHIKLNL